MDAPNPASVPTAANRTPLRIGAVGLIVRDLGGMTDHYRRLLGLALIDRSDGTARLGTPGGLALLDLEHRPSALADDDRQAGLYHTAFLMPTREAHGRWIAHLARSRMPITGASDHGVSEAFYLDDIEGNGIEVYNDRPPERWQRDGDQIVMQTHRLDIEAIVRETGTAGSAYEAAPEGLRIGHIHLRVGDTDEAERFYRGAMGLDLTRRRGGATFMSSGGYHHHVGANVWHSPGAGRRNPDRAGLAWFAVETADRATLDMLKGRMDAAGIETRADGTGFAASDPWGTRIRFAAAG